MPITDLPDISRPLPWQQREWTQVGSLLTKGRLPHALMLLGSKHTGKSHLALCLARLLLCAKPEGLLNCGGCHACRLSAQGSHGDLRWVSPIEPSRTIRVDQIRELVEFSALTSGLGERKVIVVAPADKMNVNAFNALLKVLEEPTDDTYLFLICNQLHSIPATIRSRCCMIRMGIPDQAICLSWLDSITADPVQSRHLYDLADQLPMLAEQLYRSGEADMQDAKRRALEGMVLGHTNAAEVAQLWSNQDINSFLAFFASNLQMSLRSLSHAQIRMGQTKALFQLLDDVNKLCMAVNAGANPKKSLLLVDLLSKYQDRLGDYRLGDSIVSNIGGSAYE